jgi:hypothetical protein
MALLPKRALGVDPGSNPLVPWQRSRETDLEGSRDVWAKAVHRVAAEGISPEQAVDEASARIKQILSE